jgi:valyl-tRNA synthetase
LNLEKAQAASGFTLEELAAPAIRAKAPYDTGGATNLVHKWMFSRLSSVVHETSKAFNEFRFHEACRHMYQFFWGDFCDWYIEWVKPELSSTDRNAAVAAWRNIFALLDASIRLLHPVMPFLTEELWHRLPQPEAAKSIALDAFPEPAPAWTNAEIEKDMAVLQEIITAARNIRSEMKVDQKKKVAADFSSKDARLRSLVEQSLEPITRLATLSELKVSAERLDPAGAAVRSTADFDLRIAYGDAIDKGAEIAKIDRETERLTKDIESKRARLADESFTSKAPAKVLDGFRATLAAREVELEKLIERRKQLS